MSAKQIIKNIAYICGFEIRRVHPLPKSGGIPSVSDPFHEQKRFLAKARNPVIFDVGAHVGQTTLRYKELFPAASVYSFEPFPGSFVELEKSTQGLAGVHLVKGALGRTEGQAIMKVNRSAATNSLLSTDPRASEAWNGTNVAETLGEIRVPVGTIDGFLTENHQIGRIDLLKLDAQGSEMDVLVGAESALREKRVGVIYVEIIIMPGYVGQRALGEYIEYLRAHGYELHNFYNLAHTNDGRLNQLDALFVSVDMARTN
jgi:FkbM family methyltransferase